MYGRARVEADTANDVVQLLENMLLQTDPFAA